MENGDKSTKSRRSRGGKRHRGSSEASGGGNAAESSQPGKAPRQDATNGGVEGKLETKGKKLEICFKFQDGSCTRGDSCRFAHVFEGGADESHQLAIKQESGGKNEIKVKAERNDVKNVVCYKFQGGSCSRGDSCRFAHVIETTVKQESTSNVESEICLNFQKGNCRRGEACKYSHVLESLGSAMVIDSNSANPGSSIKQPSPDVCFKFQTGECKRGDTCKFAHVLDSEMAIVVSVESAKPASSKSKVTAEREVCLKFLKGECKKGDSCKFAHSGVVDTDSSPISSSTPQGSKLTDPDVCFKFQKGECRRGESCKFAHIKVEAAAETIQSSAQLEGGGKISGAKILGSLLPDSKGESKALSAPTAAAAAAAATTKPGVFMTATRFDSLPISAESKKAILGVMKYEFLTQVQEASLPEILKGIDCLAKAKTGTGKTLAFLIPAVERMSRSPKLPNALPTLVLSPTRELAMQIAKEAEILLTFHSRMKVACVVGGTNISSEKRILQGGVDILVATPGRLIDHLKNTKDFSQLCKGVKCLIMDEADQLLEMGFRPAIEEILSYMPDKANRQTLLFSATVPPTVQEIARKALRPGYVFIDTVGAEAEQTHKHVQQELVVAELQDLVPAVAAILAKQAADPEHKVIVFFTTARLTGYMAELFKRLRFPVLEIHSRKSQSQRTNTSNQFRDARSAILFSSDVSARGMDYPDVTFVLQVGLTEREQYIHRLGRTARAGKIGRGMLLIHPFEERTMLKDLLDMPLRRLTTDSLGVSGFAAACAEAQAQVRVNEDFRKSAEQAYVAWLGFYNSNLRKCGWDKEKLVEMANLFSTYMALPQVPFLEKKTVGKMGLKGVSGLRVR